ncbi:PD-(D/E)XK nuclease family protein [bacterium]|nr:PD-(D/E)XK nuclease family protein [bacterium]
MNTNRNGHPTDHVSVSQINLYLMCPLKYRFVYVDKLPRPFKPIELALGTAFHAAVEWWHKRRKIGSSPSAEDVARILAADMRAQAEEKLQYKNGESLDDVIQVGGKLANAYVKGFRGKPVHDTEVPFRVPLVDLETGEDLGLPLDGYFDLLEAEDTVVETKTAARAYDNLTILNHLQLTAYGYAYRILYDREPNLRIDVVTKTKNPRLQSVKVFREKSDMVRFFHLAKSVCRSISSGCYHPKSGWQCGNCEFAEPCRRWRG